MYECTVSSQHDLKAGIFETLKQLGSSTNPATEVVVPSSGTFNAWTHGMKVPTLPESASCKVKLHCNNIKQYLLHICCLNQILRCMIS